MNCFKLIAMPNYKIKALGLFTGAAGSISHTLARVSPPEATALVEAMPEEKIAEWLLALADYILEVEGTPADPILTFASTSKTQEDVLIELDDDILAIIHAASEEKLARVITYFADTFVRLRDQDDEENFKKLSILQSNSQKVGSLKIEQDGNGTMKITVHPATYSKFELKAKNEISSNEKEQLDANSRLLIDYIKYKLLEKIIYALFYSITKSEKLPEVKQRLIAIVDKK